MARIVRNRKGFRVIAMSGVETQELGRVGVCDFCNSPSENGYYIAVLNNWYCKKCYEDFARRSHYYHEDATVEKKNFERVKQIFNIE